jgi:hypothetical protein
MLLEFHALTFKGITLKSKEERVYLKTLSWAPVFY